MEHESSISGGSKRKRTLEWTMTVPESEIAEIQVDEAMTPKRSRQSNRSTDESSRPEHEHQRSVRRKHARYGLSSLNKRHAQVHEDSTKASRFQEGSMSDKPSAQPPSVFTRGTSNPRLPAAGLANVDHLMSQYHDGDMAQSVDAEDEDDDAPESHDFANHVAHSPTPAASRFLVHSPAPAAPRLPTESHARSASPLLTESHAQALALAESHALDDSSQKSGLFRFGRMLTSSFNLWGSVSRTWKESKEDLTVRNIEENRKRVMEKAEYEAKYQELKKSGQFAFTVVHNNTLRSPVSRNTIASPEGRSAFASPSPCKVIPSPGNYNTVGYPGNYSVIRSPVNHNTIASPSKYSVVKSHANHNTVASPVNRKVVGQDDYDPRRKYTITNHSRNTSHDSNQTLVPPPQLAALFNRAESPQPQPQSPEKPLKPRKSFFSLRAPSLSSLRRGRSEANLNNVFTCNLAAAVSPEKSNFLTLPNSQSKKDLNKQYKLSKRVSNLEAKLADARQELNHAITNASPLPRLPSRFEKYTPTPKQTVRSKLAFSRLPSLPSERLFQEQQVQQSPSRARPRPVHSKSFDVTFMRDSAVVIDSPPHSEKPSLDLPTSSYYPDPMDPATLASSDPLEQGDDAYNERPSLDARLRALDSAVKSQYKSKSKKRKSASTDDLTYKPTKDEQDDYDDWDLAKEKPRRKRRSTGKKASNAGDDRATTQETAHEDLEQTTSEPSDSAPVESSGRTSLDSQDPLDTIREEENITVASRNSRLYLGKPNTGVDTLVHTSKSVFKQTSSRPRSASPDKSRRVSPPPSAAYSKPNEVIEDQVSIIPRFDSVPSMPTGSQATEQATAGAERDRRDTVNSKEQYDWPEDIF